MTLTVVPTVNLTSTPPSVSLQITDSTGANSSVTVQRNVAGHGTVNVRTSDGGPFPLTTSGSTKVGTLVDYEAPFGVPITYTVNNTGLTASLTVDATQTWLIHPFKPGLSMPLTFRPGTLQEETLPVARGVLRPVGRQFPIVVTDGVRQGASSTLIVETEGATELGALKNILADSAVLLLNIPPSVGALFDTCYISIDAAKFARLTDVVIDGSRDVTLPFDVVESPISGTGANTSGGTPGARTWADLAVERVTWANAETAYSTWAKAEAGTPG